MTRIRGVDLPHFRMTPSDCSSFTTTSTSAGESFSIVAICLTLLFPSTKAKTCLCFRGQELITLCSACTIRCGGVFCLANCKRPSGCATWCGGEPYRAGVGRSAGCETRCAGATCLGGGKGSAGAGRGAVLCSVKTSSDQASSRCPHPANQRRASSSERSFLSSTRLNTWHAATCPSTRCRCARHISLISVPSAFGSST